MDYNAINKLVEKYFAGETSLQEERELQTYFRQPTVHESLRSYQPLFQLFRQEQEYQLDAKFEARLLEQLKITEPSRGRVIHLRTWVMRAAAVFILAIGAWWLLTQPPSQPEHQPVAQAIDWSKYEPETPEEAYKILKASLNKTADELNGGASKAAHEMKKVNKMNEVFN